MKIITDTSSVFSPEEGKTIGVTVIPVSVTINNKSYRDYEDISCEELLEMIEAGGVPASSQPAIGDVLEVFENTKEEILMLPVGDGLSGTYQNACGAKNCIEENDHIHIMDSKTLAGPLHYLVQKAVKLRDAGVNIQKIKAELQKSIDESISFVIPVDFDFLKRSGRLTPIAAKIGGIVKIVPVLTQTEDRKRIAPLAIKRSARKALEAIINHLKEMGVDENYVLSIGHGGVKERAQEVLGVLRERFQGVKIEVFCLPPALIGHGGPGCITVHAIRK